MIFNYIKEYKRSQRVIQEMQAYIYELERIIENEEYKLYHPRSGTFICSVCISKAPADRYLKTEIEE